MPFSDHTSFREVERFRVVGLAPWGGTGVSIGVSISVGASISAGHTAVVSCLLVVAGFESFKSLGRTSERVHRSNTSFRGCRYSITNDVIVVLTAKSARELVSVTRSDEKLALHMLPV